ncbi:g9394 [Coccomyxa elongata]
MAEERDLSHNDSGVATLRHSSRESNGRSESSTESHDVHEDQKETFNWTKQWYPIASEMDLDPSKPHSLMLLGKQIVLWRDNEQQWRCFEDVCPHRKVPLSEGRVEGGGLQCGYHGWIFGSDGRPTHIPQLHSVDRKAEENACASGRSCAAAYPVQVQQGLVWVWGESGSTALLESLQRQPAINPLKAKTDPGKFTQTYVNYIRDLPGGFQEWIENMTDQSHVAFAHHGVAGNRHGPEAGHFKSLSVEERPRPEDGFNFVFDWSANSKTVNKSTTFEYIPPVYNGFTVAGGVFSLWIYAVPVSATCTRLIINAGGNFPVPPLPRLSLADPAALLRRLDPRPALLKLAKTLAGRWGPHLQLNAVNDGDIVFMHQQSRNNRAIGRRTDYNRHYFTPGDSDRGVMAWRRWLVTKAGGGPVYPDTPAVDPFRDSLGKLRRRELLDRHHQHTQHCAACSKALGQVRTAQKAFAALAVATFLFLVALLGSRGCPILSVGPLASAVVTAAATAALFSLRRLESQFTFTDWVNAEK